MSHETSTADEPQQDRIRDDADKILLGEFVRLANDYKAGKRLSPSERTFVQRMAIRFESDVVNQGEWVGNLTELAAILGCARRSITRWKNLPEAP